MRVLILEDESGVAKNLVDLIHELDPSIEVLAILQSIEETLGWMSNNSKPDLGFFDIRLADGESFDIFDKTDVDFPVVFTTAYDEYALRAFKVNSIDYLLKPIDSSALEKAISKYHSLYSASEGVNHQALVEAIKEIKSASGENYRRSFLIHHRDRIIPLGIEKIAFFYLEDELVFCQTHDNNRYAIDQSLEKIVDQVSPDEFYRVNRQFVVSRQSVVSALQHFNRKLKPELKPKPVSDVLISKIKVSSFKNWLEI